METPTVGILALQGNVREHAKILARLGARVVEVRTPAQLALVDGLVIPGGESTTIMRLLHLSGLDEALREFDRPVLGTCAGMIVLDRDHLGLVDLRVRRNAFGRQVASFETELDFDREETPVPAVFIRAPWIAEVGPDVEVLATFDGHPVAAREGRYLVLSFHPELTDDTRLHQRFLTTVKEGRLVRS